MLVELHHLSCRVVVHLHVLESVCLEIMVELDVAIDTNHPQITTTILRSDYTIIVNIIIIVSYQQYIVQSRDVYRKRALGHGL